MKTIVETAVETRGFSSLVGAVKQAGFVNTLNGEGPFTVFAPTDDAFASVTIPKNKETLQKILKHHVIPGKVMSSDVVDGCLKTIGESKICFDGMTVENANITGTDIECSNGVIHIIDNVMIPN